MTIAGAVPRVISRAVSRAVSASLFGAVPRGTGADLLLYGEDDGLAFDFTNQSARIKDTTTLANNYKSTGIVAGGELVGPSGKLTYTSPSNKLTLQSDGYYKYQAHNLCLQSETSTNATWTKSGTTAADGVADPFGGTTAFTITEDGTTGTHRIFQSLTAVLNAQYVNTFYVKQASGDRDLFVRIIGESGDTNASIFDLSAGTSSDTGTAVSTITAIGSGWYLCTVSASASVTASTNVYYGLRSAGNNSYAGDSASGVTICRPHVYRYPANTDYIKTTDAAKYALPIEYDTSGNCLGLLVEEARTNLLTYSNTLSDAAWSSSLTSLAKDVAGIDGLTSAWTATDGSGSVPQTLAQTVTVSANGTHCASFYLKKEASLVSTPIVQVAYGGGTGQAYRIQIQPVTGAINEQVETVSSGATTVTDEGNGFWRVSMVTTDSGSNTALTLTLYPAGNSSYPLGGVSGSSTGSAVISHFQVEAGSFPTSPVVTYGSASSRLADNISIATSAFPHSATVNSGLVQYVPANVSTAAIALRWDDGTANEVVSLGHDASANLGLTVTDGGAAQTAPLTDGTATAAATETLGYSWKANDFLFSDNGATAAADTSGTLPTVTSLDIGPTGVSKIKKVLVVPVEKTSTEVETYGLTS